MMFDIKTFGKLPIAFQVMLGFVLAIYGAKMLYDTVTFAAGDYRFVVLFLSVGVLYIVAGAPSLIEGIMIMYNDRTKPAADGVPE